MRKNSALFVGGCYLVKPNKRIKCVKIIEEHLRNYNAYKMGIKTLEKQLDYIMPKITASYSDVGFSGTFNTESDTERFAIERIEGKKTKMIQSDIEEYRIIIDSIDDAVSDLEDIEKEFVRLRYKERKSIDFTADQLGYSRNYLFEIRNKILDKLLISLRGLVHF